MRRIPWPGRGGNIACEPGRQLRSAMIGERRLGAADVEHKRTTPMFFPKPRRARQYP